MTAIKTTGLGDNAYVAGWNLSSDTQQLSRIAGGPSPLEVTDITQSAVSRLLGERDGAIEWVSYFDKQAGQAHKTLGTLPTVDVLVSYFHQPGLGVGCSAAHLVARQVNYDPNREASGMLTFGVQALGDGYGLEWGQGLTAGVRTDTAATSPATGLDGGASSAFGLQAYLHVFSVTGTSVTVKLQDSADNATFADISGAAFTAVTPVLAGTAAGGWQRIGLSNTSTVRRYVRAVTTGTFSNAQFAVSMVRNEVAGVVF